MFSIFKQKNENDHKFESLIANSRKWQQDAEETHLLLENARQQLNLLSEDVSNIIIFN